MSRAPVSFYTLVSRSPNGRDVALDRDVMVSGNRIAHEAGVMASPSLMDAVDPVFGPPAHPFDILVVDHPADEVRRAGRSAAMVAPSWRVVQTLPGHLVFGENGIAVVGLLDRLVRPNRYTLAAMQRDAEELLRSLVRDSGGTAPETAVVAWRAALLDDARRAGVAEEARHAAVAVKSTVWDRVVANMPRGGRGDTDWDCASDLLGCAGMWPAVHGGTPSPFDPLVELARMDVFVGLERGGVCCWRRGQSVHHVVPGDVLADGTPVEGDVAV